MMVDSDVLIWYFRGNKHAKLVIDKLDEFSVSAIVYMELIQGVRNKNELKILKHFIKQHNIHLIPVDAEITARAIYFLEEYAVGNGLRLSDSLIASTAHIFGDTLLTGNISHFRIIPSLDIKKFNPGEPQ